MVDKVKMGKYAVVGIVLLVILAIIIAVVVSLKRKISDSVRNRALASELDEEISTSSLTLTQVQINAYASALYTAMKGAGTDEEKIYAVFRAMGSRADVLQLVKTFGVKDGETLSEWLHSDMSASEIGKINEILAGNNINYAF